MTNILRSGLHWKYLLGTAGVIGLLGVGFILFGHRSTLACGAYIADRWSLPYFAASLVGLLFSLGLMSVALFASHEKALKIGQNLTLTVISMGITILLINLGMKLTEPPRRQDRLRYEAHDTLGYFTGSNLTFDYFSKHNEFQQTFNTDGQGLIRDSLFSLEGSSDIETVFIGDSFVAGWQVSPDENMSHQFANELGNLTGMDVSAVNLGVNGYSPIHYRLVYELFEDQFQPNLVVVVLYVGNDFQDAASQIRAGKVTFNDEGVIVTALSEERQDVARFNPFSLITDEAGHPYLVPPDIWKNGLLSAGNALVYRPLCQSLEWQRTGPSVYDFRSPPLRLDAPEVISSAECDPQIDAPCASYPARNNTSITQNLDAVFKDNYTQQDRDDIEYTFEQMRQLAAEVHENGQTLVIVIMPDGNQIPNQAVGVKPYRGMLPDDIIESTIPQEFLLAFCEAESLYCLDLLPVFEQHSEEQLYWVYEIHLTPRGHALAAEAIAEFVYEEVQLTPSR